MEELFPDKPVKKVYKYDSIQSRDLITRKIVYQRQKRECLKCSNMFSSLSEENRICRGCKRINEYHASEYD